MKSSSSSSGRAGCNGDRGGRARLTLLRLTMAGLAWVIAAGTSFASLSAEQTPQVTAGAAYHRGDLAYRRGDYTAALGWFRAQGMLA